MKLISTMMGKLLVAAFAAAMILVLIASPFLPSLSSFFNKVFPNEKNYVIAASSSEPVLELENELIVLNVGDSINSSVIFDNLVSSSAEGQELIGALAADYSKPLDERTQVFIYKIQNNGFTVLKDEIDPSTRGEWAVLFVVETASGSSVLKAQYVFI